MAAHIAIGRISKVYHKELKDTIYQICGPRDEQRELISTRKDRSINCSIHLGIKPSHSSPGEPDVRKHDRSEEGDD